MKQRFDLIYNSTEYSNYKKAQTLVWMSEEWFCDLKTNEKVKQFIKTA